MGLKWVLPISPGKGTFWLLMVSGGLLAPLWAVAQQGGQPVVPTLAPEDQQEAEAPFVPTARKTIVPWVIDVYGRNYEDFTNHGASRVISDWLTNALIDLDLFNIVNRERIRAVLSERNLELSGFARDVSGDVPENELANAGKLLSVNYILLGNVKNLGSTSEIDFKLLDVETTTYSPVFRLNFQIPFNASIERFKSVVDRIVAELASSFPIEAAVLELTPDGHLVLAAGSKNGLVEGLSADLRSRRNEWILASGVVTAVTPVTSEVVLDGPPPAVDVGAVVARITLKPGPEAVLASGDLEIRRGNFAKAKQILAEGIESYPGHGRILALHARSCWRLGDYGGAVVSYREALKVEPNDLELLEEAVRVLVEAGQFQEVVELLRDERRTQKTLDLELLLGGSLALQGYPLQAREAFKRAFRIDPEHPGPHLRLAVQAARAGDLTEMERELRLAGESGAGTLEVDLAIAIVRGQLADPPSLDSAQALIDRAFGERDFTALATASELAAIRPEMWRQALELAEKSVGVNPAFVRGHIHRAEAYVLGGELSQAIDVLELALAEQPNNVALLVRNGELLARAGDYANAELRLLQAIDLAPSQWRAADVLGDSYHRQGEFLKAVDAYQKSLSIAEGSNPTDLTIRLKKLGRSAVLGDQHSTALPYLERCVALEPDNRECRYYLGLCHHRAHLPESDEKAIVNLRAAVDFSSDANYYLGSLYDRRENFSVAAEWYQKCVEVGCSLAERAIKRVDEIETIRGTIIGQIRGVKELTLDVGAIHGVVPSQIAMVLHLGKVIGRLRMEQVLEKTSVAKIQRGGPRTGHQVQFRPRRPRGLTAVRAPKKGVMVRWQQVYDPGLAAFVIYRRDDSNPAWKEKKKIGPRDNSWIDRSAKPGRTYRYRIVAVSVHNQESLISRECEFRPE